MAKAGEWKTAAEIIPGSLRIYRNKRIGSGTETFFRGGIFRGSLRFKGSKRRTRVAVKVHDVPLAPEDIADARFLVANLRENDLPVVKMDFVQDEDGQYHQVMPLFVRGKGNVKPE